MSFVLIVSIGIANFQRFAGGKCVTRLLSDVRELMGEETAALFRLGPVLSCAEYNVRSHGVRKGIHSKGRIRCAAAGVDTHVTEIMAEARLEKGKRRAVQTIAGRAKHFIDY